MKEMKKFISSGILHVVTIVPVIVWAMIAIIFAMMTVATWQGSSAVLRGMYVIATVLFFFAAIIRKRTVAVNDFTGLDRERGRLILQNESSYFVGKQFWRPKDRKNLRAINLPDWPEDTTEPLIVPFLFPYDADKIGSVIFGKLAMHLKRRQFDNLELWTLAGYSGDAITSLGKMFVKSALEDGRVQLVLENDYKDLKTFTNALHEALMMVDSYKTSMTRDVFIELTVRRDRVGHTIYY